MLAMLRWKRREKLCVCKKGIRKINEPIYNTYHHFFLQISKFNFIVCVSVTLSITIYLKTMLLNQWHWSKNNNIKVKMSHRWETERRKRRCHLFEHLFNQFWNLFSSPDVIHRNFGIWIGLVAVWNILN